MAHATSPTIAALSRSKTAPCRRLDPPLLAGTLLTMATPSGRTLLCRDALYSDRRARAGFEHARRCSQVNAQGWGDRTHIAPPVLLHYSGASAGAPGRAAVLGASARGQKRHAAHGWLHKPQALDRGDPGARGFPWRPGQTGTQPNGGVTMANLNGPRNLSRRTVIKAAAAASALQLTGPFIIKARGETPLRI